MAKNKSLNGWIVTAWLALFDLVIVGAAVASVGLSEEGVLILVRLTARISFVLFLAAFAASSVRKLWPNGFTTWLLRNRRYVGVGFAFAHFVHLGTLFLLRETYPAVWAELVTPGLIILGGTGYVFIALMTATSFDRTTRWLGARRWKALHLTGGYFIWLVFALTYIPRATNSVVFAPAAVLVVAVLGVRLWKAFRLQPRRSPARRSAV